jgi:signal transduction histidine kinase/ActR/RegA family two-component response regulator
MMRNDGTTFDAHIAMKALDPSDLSKGAIGTIMDITALKEAERERESLRNQLVQSQKMEALGTLTGGIAHDFNNLLTIINGYTELALSEKTEDDPNYSDLRKVLQTGRKGAELVERLMALSRKSGSSPQPLELNSVVENSVALMKRAFRKMIEIETVPEKDLAMVNADPTQIEQLLMNLCVNAQDAMPEGGRLGIETRNVEVDENYCRSHPGAKPGPHVLIEVWDSGTGMNKETMDRMFDPFFTTKGWDFRKGTGLGLSVARGIVEQHGGWITCQSELGKGTIFRIYVPAIVEAPVAEKPVSAAEAVPAWGKILLVDGEEYVRGLAKRILEREGYPVTTASNGKEALQIYSREHSDIALIVLDLIMSQMSGEKCLEELLKINPHVKVIISSGHFQEAPERLPLGAMARGFVNKPYDVKQLVQTVRAVLDSKGHVQ